MLYTREGGSGKHLGDIAGILKVSGENLDRACIERWSRDLGLAEIRSMMAAGPSVKP
jgi:hypothetical protein